MKNRELKGQELWSGLQSGNEKALGDIYDLYVDFLFHNGIKMSDDKSYTMDCIHDLFLDIYKYKSKLALPKSVSGYLLIALKRKINRKYKSKLAIVPDNEVTNTKYAYESSETVEEKIIAKESKSHTLLKLAQAVNCLTSSQKKAIQLRFHEDRSYEEISQILNVSIQTSRTIIYRGVKKLREHLSILLLGVQFFIF